MQCRPCGGENPAEARFCLHCGAPQALRCARCGQDLPAEASFCMSCGEAVGSLAAKRTEAPAVAGSAGKVSPPPRHRPPRSQARERLARARRDGEARGFRARRSPRPVAPHPGGHARRHGRLHRAGAGDGPRARCAERSLCARSDALRDGGGGPPLPWRRCRGGDLPAREHPAGRALLAQPGGSSGPRAPDPASAREGSRRATAGC